MMSGEPENPVEFIIYHVGRLLSWAEDQEKNLPFFIEPGPLTADTPSEYKTRTEATHDVVYKFQQLLRRFELTNNPDTMIAYLKSTQDYFKMHDHTNKNGFANKGDTSSKIYHEAQRNMEFIFIEYERYRNTGGYFS